MEDCMVSPGDILFPNTTTTACENLYDVNYWPVIKEQKSVLWMELLFSALFFVVLVVGIISNSITLAAFCQFKGMVLCSNNHLMVLLNLCVCDNITVFFVAPLTFTVIVSDRVFQSVLYQQDNDLGTTILCNAIGFIFNYTSRAILFCLAIGASDRFFAIYVPFKYKSIVTPLRVKIMILTCHAISLFVSVAIFLAGKGYSLDGEFSACHYNFEDIVKPTCKQNNTAEDETCYNGAIVSNPEVVGTVYFFLVLLVAVFPAVIMVVSSVTVVWKLFARLREKKAEHGTAKERGKLLKKGSKEKTVGKPKIDPQEQAAVTITYLVVLYVICYLPWWIISFETFLEYTGTIKYGALLGNASQHFIHYFMLYLTLMTFVSSALNPLIYFGRNRLLMEKLEDLIKYKATLKKTPLRNQISKPLMIIQTF